MTDTPRHDYDQLIANWMARPQADQGGERPQERMGFMRSGMESTLREAGFNADELAREMAHFDAAAMRFLNGTHASGSVAPASAASYDFDQSFRDWTQDPKNRSGRLADPANRMGAARAVATASRGKLEAELRDAGSPDADAAGELARYDEAAARFLDDEGKRWAEESRNWNPLGFWGWIGALWISGSVAVGAFGLISALLLPLRKAGRLDQTAMLVPAAMVSAIVFAAALLMARKLIRDYREVGFVLFWLPMILCSQILGVFPATLTKMLTDSMGPDFLPLALPIAGLTGGGLVLASSWVVWRHWPGRIPNLSARPDIHPLMALLVAGFSVLFFTIGAEKFLEWGYGPSLVVGFLITGLLARIYPTDEITWAFAPVVALPLALLAAEMPPSNLAALTVLGLALAAGLLAMLVTWARRERRTTLFTSLTAAALALALVIAPTGPSPALWLADKLGHPLRTPGEAAMHLYARLYETESGHAVLAALDGYRSGAAQVRIAQYDDTQQIIEMAVDIRNIGERGIANIRVDLIGDGEISADFDVCARPVIDRSFYPPLWPGDEARVNLYWILPTGCPASQFAEVAGRVRSGIEARGRGNAIPSFVIETGAVDPAERFRKDARAWLGL